MTTHDMPAELAGIAEKISAWLRHLTAHAPQKYHATITRAWTEIVGHHVTADPSVTDFEVFAEQNPALLDKRLLTRHYTAATLAAPQVSRAPPLTSATL